MTTWQEEAVGIEPWPKQRIEWMDAGGNVTGGAWFTGPWYAPNNECNAVVALENPDVCAAFDRRLALRLGAPEGAVREGVRFYRSSTVRGKVWWEIDAGAVVVDIGETMDVPVHRWDGPGFLSLLTDDPLLARVRAWRSVPDPVPG